MKFFYWTPFALWIFMLVSSFALALGGLGIIVMSGFFAVITTLIVSISMVLDSVGYFRHHGQFTLLHFASLLVGLIQLGILAYQWYYNQSFGGFNLYLGMLLIALTFVQGLVSLGLYPASDPAEKLEETKET